MARIIINFRIETRVLYLSHCSTRIHAFLLPSLGYAVDSIKTSVSLKSIIFVTHFIVLTISFCFAL